MRVRFFVVKLILAVVCCASGVNALGVHSLNAVCLDYNKIRVEWSASGVTNYASVNIERKEVGGSYSALANAVVASPYTDTTALEGKRYIYRLTTNAPGPIAQAEIDGQTFLRLTNRVKPILDKQGNLYAIERNSNNRIFKSVDGGATWLSRGQLVPPTGDVIVGSLFVDPLGYIYLGTGNGSKNFGDNKVYRSTTPDGSSYAPVRNWNNSSDLTLRNTGGYKSNWYHSWGMDYSEEQNVWVIACSNQDMIQNNAYVYRSTDGIIFSEDSELVIRYQGNVRHCHAVKFDPYRDWWFITVGDKIKKADRSQDAITWTPMSWLPWGGWTALTVTEGCIIGGTDEPFNNKVYRSTDSGDSVSAVLNLTGKYDSVTWGAIAYPEGEIWVTVWHSYWTGKVSSIWVSKDDGLTWRLIAEGPSYQGAVVTPDFGVPAVAPNGKAVGDNIYIECADARYVAKFHRLIEPLPPATEVDRIGEVGAQTGQRVHLQGKVTTGSFNGYFWMQEPDRSSAIKIFWGGSVDVGKLTSVYGVVSIQDGLRIITADAVSQDGITPPTSPLNLRAFYTGGASPAAGIDPVGQGVGLYNVGLLVRLAGEVTCRDVSSPSNKWFVISDGSLDADGQPCPGIKVLTGAVDPPAVNTTVGAVGVIEAESSPGGKIPVLRIRSASDIIP